MNIQVCRNTSDAEALYLPQRLFLKPLAKVNITVQLPSNKVIGKAISNWELMERFRAFIQPETFSSLKVTKSNSDVIRFEGELEDRRKLEKVLGILDDRSIKLDSYPDSFKLRASETKVDFPHRHSWDSFFRDATNMDEMKAGERPDTLYLSNLPIKWFVHDRDQHKDDAKPSEHVIRKIFEKFGKVRCVDVPICDPYRGEMKPHMTGIRTPAHEQELYFEAYVQFDDYGAFVKAMDAFRGMKLMRKPEKDAAETAEIRVDFDKTKHLSDATIKRRSIVRDRLVNRERAREEKEKEEQVKIKKREEHDRRKTQKVEREKMAQMVEREERRKAKRLAKLKAKEALEINSTIAHEKKKLIRTQRKLQSVRLIEELFRRIQLKHKSNKVDLSDLSRQSNQYNNKNELKKLQSALFKDSEHMTSRERLMSKYINAQERELEHQRDKINKALNGKLVLRSALQTKKPKPRTSSISSISSEEFYEEKARKIKTERPSYDDPMTAGLAYPQPPLMPTYNYPFHYNSVPYPYAAAPPGGYYAGAPLPYPMMAKPMGGFQPRGRGYPRRSRGPYSRGAYRGGGSNQDYYMYFKRFADGASAEYEDRPRSRSRSRSRKRYSNSRSRSRSRSRHRRRSRSRSRRSRSSSYSRSRSRSRRSRSRSRRSRSYSRSRRTKSRTRSRSRSRSEHKRSKEKSAERSKPADQNGEKNDSTEKPSGDSHRNETRRHRSKSWSLPKEADKNRLSWSKSPSPCKNKPTD